MSTASLKARLENTLLKIWYQGYKPGLPLRTGLRVMELTYSVLRQLTRQDKKSHAARNVVQASKGNAPVVLVVGNLIVGGAGKTPIVMAVCRQLEKQGKKTGVISRGYGRKQDEPVLLTPGSPTPSAAEVGDEPLFLFQQTGCPVAVCADRAQAARLLMSAFPDLDLIVSDDGLQHSRLERKVEWVVFDERGQGNGRLLPAGPLREPLSRLSSVDAVVCSNIEPTHLAKKLHMTPTGKWHAAWVKLTGFRQLATGVHLTAQQARAKWVEETTAQVMAFTGIANPDKLFKALEVEGIQPAHRLGLPDHFNYPPDFCTQYSQEILITTGKDAVKLEHSNPRVWVAEIEVELPPALISSLEECIGPTID